jgi:hypothetical protein
LGAFLGQLAQRFEKFGTPSGLDQEASQVIRFLRRQGWSGRWRSPDPELLVELRQEISDVVAVDAAVLEVGVRDGSLGEETFPNLRTKLGFAPLADFLAGDINRGRNEEGRTHTIEQGRASSSQRMHFSDFRAFFTPWIGRMHR